jgi:hypothetical protein
LIKGLFTITGELYKNMLVILLLDTPIIEESIMLSAIKNVFARKPVIITFRHTYAKDCNRVFPAVTWAFELDHNNHTVRFSFAVCSHEDQFCKATGRDIAGERLNEGPWFTMPMSDATLVTAAHTHLEELVESRRAYDDPQRGSDEMVVVHCIEAMDTLHEYFSSAYGVPA